MTLPPAPRYHAEVEASRAPGRGMDSGYDGTPYGERVWYGMKSLGIALGGGSLRGAAHIGVLQVLEENGIRPQYMAGTSSGSLVAACYAAGVSPDELEKVALRLTRRDYLDFNWQGMARYLLGLVTGRPVLPAGFLKGNRLERLVYELTRGKRLQDVEMPLAIVAADLNSGKKVVFTNQNIEKEGTATLTVRDALLSEAVRASTCIPVVFVPRRLGVMQLVDGGLREIVPVHELKTMGADYILGVDLQAGKFNKPVKDFHEIISRSIDIMIQETSQLDEQLFADLVIFPDVSNLGLGDLSGIPECIRAGRIAMKKHMARVKAALGRGIQ